MRNNPRGVLSLQDELSGWFGSMERYSSARGGAKDRGFWLQAFNGGPYNVDRVGRGAFNIDNIGVSLLGGVQPDVIRKIAAETYDDGLIQRLLPIVLRPATVGHDKPTPAIADEYARLVERLYELTPPAINVAFKTHARGVGARIAVELDDEAQVIRRQLEQKHVELAQLVGLNKKLAAHIGKYNGYFARLCLIWHCIENAASGKLPGSIGAGTARRVAEFLHEFLLPHAFAFYGGVLGLADDHDRLSAVAGYILAHKLQEITNRDVQRGDRSMRRLTRRDTDAVFEQLEARGWVSRKPGRRPSDPPRWRVNPEVHRLFAQRAEEEAARREEAARVITEMNKKVSK